MKKFMTVVFATLFAVSTGAFAAAHMKGEKDMKKGEKSAKKGGDTKSSAKKGDKKAKK
jgi:hypothetical protein